MTEEQQRSTVLNSLAELAPLQGGSLGVSSWLRIDQDRIGAFADATDDHQWIHVDPERAAQGPFGTTIAHGFLTLSLLIPMWQEVLTVRGASTAVNYGLNKVRFTNPVPAGGRVRLHAGLAEVRKLDDAGVQLVVDARIELAGSARPACVAEPVFRMYE